MGSIRTALIWLAIAASAILLGYRDVDLRLLAAGACGIAALAGTGVIGRARRSPDERAAQPANPR